MNLEIKTFASSITPVRWSMHHAKRLAAKKNEIVVDKDFMGIVFILSDEVEYSIDSVGVGAIKGLHFAIVNTPAGTCRLTLPKGSAELFSVQLDPRICKKCRNDFPVLDLLLEGQNNRRPVSLTAMPTLATPAMIEIIYDITKEVVLRSSHRDTILDLYLAAKGSQLFLLSLAQINSTLSRNTSFLN